MVFAFDTVKLYKNTRNVPFEEKHQSLANAMSAYWVQFARTGNPNKKDLLKWPAYDPTKDQYIEFGELLSLIKGYERKDWTHGTM